MQTVTLYAYTVVLHRTLADRRVGWRRSRGNLLAHRHPTGRNLWALDVDFFPLEHHEHSLIRTERKAPIANRRLHRSPPAHE